jgi:hypothetical protein
MWCKPDADLRISWDDWQYIFWLTKYISMCQRLVNYSLFSIISRNSSKGNILYMYKYLFIILLFKILFTYLNVHHRGWVKQIMVLISDRIFCNQKNKFTVKYLMMWIHSIKVIKLRVDYKIRYMYFTNFQRNLVCFIYSFIVTGEAASLECWARDVEAQG